MPQEWDIRPRSDTCVNCETSFQDEQDVFSALVLREGQYRRDDFCATCWGQQEPAAAAYSTWQGFFRLPPPPRQPALEKETAESILRRLMEEKDESRRSVIYILAVMLERKRVLVEREVKRPPDGPLIRVYEHRQTGDTFLVPEPGLRLDQLEQVQQDVIAMLGGDPQKRTQEHDEDAAEENTGGDSP